ncbi:hypothetical protein [Streptomyces sp. NPDC017529]|uniref:hypothetical protein n=1 Tax=Streptomyces sp. NPDC017529 TaxID=3365000 RepID=UPI0037B1739A
MGQKYKPHDEGPRMTLRVSRDSGRTYGEQINVYTGDAPPPENPVVWPLCQCPKHRENEE